MHLGYSVTRAGDVIQSQYFNKTLSGHGSDVGQSHLNMCDDRLTKQIVNNSEILPLWLL